MPAAFVQGTSYNSTTSQNPTLALGSNATAGNLLAGFIRWESDTVTLNSITDSLGNTFVLVNNPTAHPNISARGALYYAKNISGGADTLTFNFSASVSSAAVVHEASGLDTTAPLDKNAIQGQFAPGGGTDAVTSGSITTTDDGEYIFGSTLNANGSTLTAGTGYTQRTYISGTMEFMSESQVQASAGAIAATFTGSGNGGIPMTGIITFKVAAAGKVSYQPWYHRAPVLAQ